MKTKLSILMSILLIGCGLFVSCKESIDPSTRSFNYPQGYFTNNIDFFSDPSIESIDRNPGGTGLSPNSRLTAEQTAWITAAKNIMNNEGITDIEKDMDKTPTMQLPILTQCQGQAYKDYFQTCSNAVDNYDNAKADCLRNVGYPAAAISIFNGQLSWKNFTSWLKGNKGGNTRGFIYTIAIANLAATECIESKLSNARSLITDANKEFAVRYARCK